MENTEKVWATWSTHTKASNSWVAYSSHRATGDGMVTIFDHDKRPIVFLKEDELVEIKLSYGDRKPGGVSVG